MFKWFYNISWGLQVAVGLVLFAVAAVLEALVLAAYLDDLWLAVSLAAGLEAAKVLTIVLYRILGSQNDVPYPTGVRWVTLGFRGMLLSLSAVCSLMFLALHLDRPGMAQVRAADLAAEERVYSESRAAVEANHRERRERALAQIAEQDQRRREAVSARYLAGISELESMLNAEMNNVIGGEFKGKRYKELQARLDAEKTAYDRALRELQAAKEDRPADQMERLEADHQVQVSAAAREYRERLGAIRADDYQDDPRVEHPMARAFVSVLGAVFEEQPSTLQFVFFFALFLSVTLELGIWVSFEHITLARLPVFAAGYRAGHYVAGKVVETEGELRGFEIEDELARAKIRRKQRGITDLLSDPPDDKLA